MGGAILKWGGGETNFRDSFYLFTILEMGKNPATTESPPKEVTEQETPTPTQSQKKSGRKGWVCSMKSEEVAIMRELATL